ncbi:hypothetical protein AB0M95_15570 [Sphaerisporangium sp. NPDC051017]|uniref:AAA family ATPase n=1 Tax=Sphaerisporangium sp. NPDC051017 TaxID=3154636 RepID=UPI00344066CC
MSLLVPKPTHVFDRDWEWEALTSFATGSHAEVSFGVVSGRRRQGKTFLLRSLTEALGGFYFEATEGTDVELLRLFGMALARHSGSPVGYPFADWRDALTFFFSLPKDRPMPRDPALYHSVLSAVAEGNNTWGGIASHIGYKSSDIAHPLNVLEDCGLLVKEKDAFRSGRTRYRIAEPLITFYQAIMRPEWTDLSLGFAAEVWERSRRRFLSKVMGPHFETLCREYALRYGRAHFGEVVAGTVADPANKSQIDVDIAVLGVAHAGETRAIKSLGEAKWDKVMDLRHLERLRRARDLLAAKGYDTTNTTLACYSGAGFHDTLRAEAKRDPAILLVDIPMLYGNA